jgi:hypothetical protein
MYSLIVLGLCLVIAIIIDKSFVDLFIYSQSERVSQTSLYLFGLMSGAIFALEIPFLVFIHRARRIAPRISIFFSLAYYLVIAVLCLALTTIAFLSFQISEASPYYTILLSEIILTSYSIGIFLIAVLCYRFVRWFRIRKQLILIVFSIGLGIFCLGTALEVLRTILQLEITPEMISPTRSPLGFLSSKFGELGVISNVFSASSFIITWYAIALLLKPYARKFGLFKHYVLISIPLLYFISQFDSANIDIFYNLRLSDPIAFSMYSTLVNASAGPAGGILFGFAFWALTRNIVSTEVRSFMVLSSVGLMLLFSLSDLNSVRIAPYPPFGIASASVFSLAAYMMLFGLFLTATAISVNTEVRKSLRNYVETSMLESMGLSEMEEKVNMRIRSLSKSLEPYKSEFQYISPSENDMKNYVNEVLDEIKKEKHPKV